MAGKKGMRLATPEMIAKARELRRQGHTFEEIKEATGISLASLNRYLKDIPKPRSQKQAAASLRHYERKERAIQVADLRASTPTAPTGTDDEDSAIDFRPLLLPATPDNYDIDGLLPDPQLIAHASALIDNWEYQRATGVVYENVPAPVLQSMYLILHRFQMWDYDAWLRNRTDWRTIRITTGLSVEDLGERLGISASSISRYEAGTRQPATGTLRKLWAGYAALQEEALNNYEMSLAYHAAYQHFANETDTRFSELELDGEEALRWITGVGANLEHEDDNFTVDHLTPLVHVRSLIPYPAWREPSPRNLWLKGYATGSEDMGSDGRLVNAGTAGTSR